MAFRFESKNEELTMKRVREWAFGLGLAMLAALAALALNIKLARAARRRQRFPPEEG